MTNHLSFRVEKGHACYFAEEATKGALRAPSFQKWSLYENGKK